MNSNLESKKTLLVAILISMTMLVGVLMYNYIPSTSQIELEDENQVIDLHFQEEEKREQTGNLNNKKDPEPLPHSGKHNLPDDKDPKESAEVINSRNKAMKEGKTENLSDSEDSERSLSFEKPNLPDNKNPKESPEAIEPRNIAMENKKTENLSDSEDSEPSHSSKKLDPPNDKDPKESPKAIESRNGEMKKKKTKNLSDGEDSERSPSSEKPNLPDNKELKESPKVIKSRNEAIERFHKNLTEKSQVTGEDWNLALKYLHNMEEAWTKIFTLKKVPQLGKIAYFGITLLSGYAANKADGYLKIVEDLIMRVDAELNKTKFGSQKTPWGQSWYDVSVLLTRMLAMYEFLGADDKIKKICHRRICEITPRWGESLGWTREEIDLVWIAVPRLITNYIYDQEAYYAETEAESYQSLTQVMEGAYSNSDETSDGIYMDWSNIYHKVATYWPLAESGEFYASMCRALWLETKIEGLIEGIFNEILHPSMDFVPYGMFGRHAEVTCTKILAKHWPNYERSAVLKTRIWPKTGLGVFKSDKFGFWVRVQRKDLVAYQSDHQHFNLAAGWIQMRKLYLKDVNYNYDNGMEWPQLKTQPGVISFKDSDNFDILKPEPGEVDKSHFAEIIDCHIGHFENSKGRVLYWKNEYKFKLYGETKIKEFGVCTDNGLVMRHEIHNLSGKTLQICTRDTDIDTKILFDCKAEGFVNPQGVVTIDNNAKVVINWRQVFHLNVPPLEVTEDSEQRMAFMFGKDSYLIESRDPYHFVLKNSEPILAGWPHVFYSDPIPYAFGGSVLGFNFDDKTLMYKRAY